ncbi:isomerase [Alsobacter metallidurans]|uniref:Isomerase n=1 Tax=Alsobacter metallidurans TaxID=340221 RepID=A0A917IAN8_9HYPH|nr:PhzF family phenazine biosynthesis protein [Alsobacter metallidurans]GGH27100.1 isomerase [Alsobacter metallidurans]
MRRRFFTLDVFTTRPMAGNPLAVVLDSQGLTDAAMQGIAREFNLSETVFVLPPADAHNRARLRIFTPGRELPFAGHPTVGAAVLLGCLDHGPGHGVLGFGLEEKVGLVACVVEVKHDGCGEATFTLPRLPEKLAAPPAGAAIAHALSLTEADLGFGAHRPTIYSAGNGFTFAPLRDKAAVDRARPDLSAWNEGVGPADHPNAFVYSRETSDASSAYYARMFAPDMGVMEDPATGSAVAAFAGVVMEFDKPGDGEHSLVIEQGYAMGRPSQITLGLSVEGGRLVRATIGGGAVVVSEGSLRL